MSISSAVGKGTTTWVRGGHNEQNYSGVKAGQGIDWSQTSMNPEPNIWKPIAAQHGDEVAQAAFSMALGMAGNSGQRAIIQMMTSDVFENSAHGVMNGYQSGYDYLAEHCAYPSAVEEILQEVGSFLDDNSSIF